jgi:hypothetical protein
LPADPKDVAMDELVRRSKEACDIAEMLGRELKAEGVFLVVQRDGNLHVGAVFIRGEGAAEILAPFNAVREAARKACAENVDMVHAASGTTRPRPGGS